MLWRRFETKWVKWVAIAVLGGCSSDDTGDLPAGMGGSVTDGNGGGGTEMAVGGSGGVVGAMGGAGSAAPPGFAADVWPILTMKCGTSSCHGDESFFPQHAHSVVDVAYEQAQPIADVIAGRVSGELMPIMPLFCGQGPGSGECLSLAEVDLIRAWVQAGAPF